LFGAIPGDKNNARHRPLTRIEDWEARSLAAVEQRGRDSGSDSGAADPATGNPSNNDADGELGRESKNKSDDEFNAFVDTLIRFPLPIVEECVNSGLGIARTKTSKGKVREWPPSAPEVAAWCENLLVYCHGMATPPARPVPPSSPPASAEEKAGPDCLGLVSKTRRDTACR